MSYSRRQLYAMGEPIGDSATRRKAGGGLILGDGGGGNQTQTSTTVSDLPEWAKPTAQRTLAKTEALTSDKPYQSYSSWAKDQGLDPSQVAGFQPLQNQAFGAVQNMQTAPGLGAAQGLAGMASLGALGASYNPYQTGQFNQQAGDYMSPYIQQALNPQLRELTRQSELQRNMNQAQAVGQNAYGGARQAIVEAERQRNLGIQQQDVLDRGYQQAFQQGQNQFNTENQLREQSRQYGAGLGMQGLQTALQGASQLGNLSNQQFGQQKDIIGLQNQLGTQQQQQQQAQINANMQNFAAEQKYPYQQLEFLSNIMRGLPMGTVQSMYQAAPTTMQTVGSLGMGAYGLSQLMKAGGGSVSSYADGGSVTSDEFLKSAVQRLSDAQLQEEMRSAAQSGDQNKYTILQEESQRRTAARSGNAGLGAIFSEQMADSVLPTEESMARGGIVAFADGDVVEDDTEDEKPTTVGRGNAAVYDQLAALYPGIVQDIRSAQYVPMTEGAYNKKIKERYDLLSKMAGESPYEGLRSQIDEMAGEREQNLAQGRGLAALQAAAAMMQGRGALQGLARAGGAFGQSYGQALQADRAEKRSLASMRINLADAERKERMGLTKDAIAAADQARKDHADAQGFALKKATALATVVSKGAAATKPPKPTAGKQTKLPEQLADAEVAYETNPSEANLKRVTALRRAVGQTKTTDVGPTRAGVDTFRTTATADTEIEKQVQKSKFTDPAWMAAYEKGDNAGMAAALDALHRSISGRRSPASAAPASRVNTNSPQPAPRRLQFDAQGNPIP